MSSQDPFINDENNKEFWKGFLKGNKNISTIKQTNKNLENTLYMGVDESGGFINHAERVYVAVFSQSEEDVLIANSFYFPKIRIEHGRTPRVIKFLKQKNFSYLYVSIGDYKRLTEERFIGTTMASLIKGKIHPKIHFLEIYLDGQPSGEINIEQENYAKRAISKAINFDKENILIKSGPRFDQLYGLVNDADLIARYILKRPGQKRYFGIPQKLFLPDFLLKQNKFYLK